MKSTDHNINNPLKTIDIDLFRKVESWQFPNIVSITREGYDLINIHDPHTIYQIIDSPDHCIYYGDMLITCDNTLNRYFIGSGLHRDEYIIYFNEKSSILDDDRLVPICTYHNAQSAIDDLSLFNRIGSHIKRDLDVYNAIISYIDKDISTNDLIIGIFTIFNYSGDPRIQELIELAITHQANKCQFEFSPVYADQITRYRDQYPDSLMVIYSNLYDLMVKYNFFRDEKYHTDREYLNLSKEVKDVFEIMYTHTSHRFHE